MAAELQHLRDLLAQTEDLKARFEAMPNPSQRLAILSKDVIRLRRAIRDLEAA